MSDVMHPTTEELESENAKIEAQVPGIRSAYEDPEWNHGDSCWMGHPDVFWHPLANRYSDNRWLLGTEFRA